MRQVEFLDVPVGQLRKNTWNTNQVTVENEEKIRKSIARNGVFKPVIVRQVKNVPGYEIIGGEHRWEAAVELGHETIPVANLGFIDETQAKEISVIDNARYGNDDALAFSELLQELGSVGELQEFLPYGHSDLDEIFSVSNISLDKLDLEENFEVDPEEEPEPPAPKVPKTHTIMRFKVQIADAERLTKLVADTQKTHGLTTSDDLTNAGDALIMLLAGQLGMKPVLETEFDESALDRAIASASAER